MKTKIQLLIALTVLGILGMAATVERVTTENVKDWAVMSDPSSSDYILGLSGGELARKMQVSVWGDYGNKTFALGFFNGYRFPTNQLNSIAIGYGALTTGGNQSDQIAIGNFALADSSHANSDQIAIGDGAGQQSGGGPSGYDHIFMGDLAGYHMSGAGSDWIAIGDAPLRLASVTGDDWIAIGRVPFRGVTATGSDRIAIGNSIGFNLTADGSDWVMLGKDITASGNGDRRYAVGSTITLTGTNTVGLGFGADATSDNDFVLGNSLNKVRVPGGKVFIATNTWTTAIAGNIYLWNSNQIIYAVSPTKTNLISNLQ